jgi:hypothetical protein
VAAGTTFLCLRAAVAKTATAGQREQIGWIARNCVQVICGIAVEAWHGSQQPAGIRMVGAIENIINRAALYHLPRIHHDNTITNARHDGHVMGN